MAFSGKVCLFFIAVSVAFNIKFLCKKIFGHLSPLFAANTLSLSQSGNFLGLSGIVLYAAIKKEVTVEKVAIFPSPQAKVKIFEHYDKDTTLFTLSVKENTQFPSCLFLCYSGFINLLSTTIIPCPANFFCKLSYFLSDSFV